MKKLRLLLFDTCNRSCAGCCNKGFDLPSLPVLRDFTSWDEVYLTGGEPMLNPALVFETICRFHATARHYLYTAKVDDLPAVLSLLGFLAGLTLTLHDQGDVAPFLALNERLLGSLNPRWSLRLNVFRGVTIPDGTNLSLWKVKPDMVWVKDCPIPEGEVFMRLK